MNQTQHSCPEIPDLLKTENLLCIQPHPDDMEIGAGATISRLTKSGTTVTVLTVTDGSVGTYNSDITPGDLTKLRRTEAETAAKILGVDQMIWLDFSDGGNLVLDHVRSSITREIRKIKPAAVMVCDPWLPYEAHSDHIQTGLAASEACLLSAMPYFYPADLQQGLHPHAVEMIAFYYTAYPNTFINADEHWPNKVAALECHRSQFPAEKLDKLKHYLEKNAGDRATECNCDLVEAFKVLSIDHLHIFEDAWRC